MDKCLCAFLNNSTLFDDQNLNATCNSHCDCQSTVFEPVCSDGITYFSPCRAGCDKYYLNGDRDVSVLITANSAVWCPLGAMMNCF